MYTANTMASAIETLGMSLPYSSSAPAFVETKFAECAAAGSALRHLMEQDIKPRDIMTMEAFGKHSSPKHNLNLTYTSPHSHLPHLNLA
jgi:dihydroxyacid dehydratase/phosphogluconate dehydratase